jgi:hypothetical protein
MYLMLFVVGLEPLVLFLMLFVVCRLPWDLKPRSCLLAVGLKPLVLLTHYRACPEVVRACNSLLLRTCPSYNAIKILFTVSRACPHGLVCLYNVGDLLILIMPYAFLSHLCLCFMLKSIYI